MLSQEILEIIVCPKCKGSLEWNTDKKELDCKKCMLRYPVTDDIPELFIDRAKAIKE